MPLSVKGYHGTTLAAWNSLDQGGMSSFRLSRRKGDWLGDGAYFWQDGPERARIWAQNTHGGQIVVIGVDIQLDECLDLLDVPARQDLVNAYNAMRQDYLAQNQPLPTQTPTRHYLDRAVIEYHVHTMSRQGVYIKCVRSPIDEGLAIYPDSAFHELAHIQIAVRDISLITNMWRHL